MARLTEVLQNQSRARRESEVAQKEIDRIASTVASMCDAAIREEIRKIDLPDVDLSPVLDALGKINVDLSPILDAISNIKPPPAVVEKTDLSPVLSSVESAEGRLMNSIESLSAPKPKKQWHFTINRDRDGLIQSIDAK